MWGLSGLGWLLQEDFPATVSGKERKGAFYRNGPILSCSMWTTVASRFAYMGCVCQSRHRRLAPLLKVVETESDSTGWAITVRSVGDEKWWLVLSDDPAADGCIVGAGEDVVAHEPCPCCTRVGVGNVQRCSFAGGRLCRSGARGSSDGKGSPRSLIVISLAHALLGPKMQKNTLVVQYTIH